MFEQFYAGDIQHPLLLWAACVAGVVFAVARRQGVHPSVYRYALVVGAVAFVDAWLTSNDIPGIGTLPGVLATAVPVAFVVLGDLRYLVLTESLEVGEGGGAIRFRLKGVLIALAWSLLVPALAQVVVRFVVVSDESRVLFLSYEVLFFALVLLRRPYMRWRLSDTGARAWHRKLDAIALLWYGTWITADVIILGFDLDVGYLVRVLPNLLYYGAFPAVLVATAPKA